MSKLPAAFYVLVVISLVTFCLQKTYQHLTDGRHTSSDGLRQNQRNNLEEEVIFLRLPNKKLPVTDQEIKRKGPSIGNSRRQGSIIIM